MGDDIQGSGIITGMPQYWLPHALVSGSHSRTKGEARIMLVYLILAE